MSTRLGVLGWPVAHSRSPAIHNAALEALGMQGEWHYQHLPVPPELFEQTVRALADAGFRGANVTIPHKHAALALADEASEAAREIGAANTLTFAPGGAIAAENTDAPGFLAALGESPRGKRALVLGAGGSARAIVWALREAGAAEVSVWNRTSERALALADDLGVRAVEAPGAAELLVNCTSVGLEKRLADESVGLEEGLGDLSVGLEKGLGDESVALEKGLGDQSVALEKERGEGAAGLQEALGEGAVGLQEGLGEGAAEPQKTSSKRTKKQPQTSAIERSATEDCALNQLGLTFDSLGEYSYVADLVYRSGSTPLLAAAAAHGAHTTDGLEILIAQGALSFRLWTERDPPLDVMRAAARMERTD